MVCSLDPEAPEAVISLCSVQRRPDGHWLLPDPDMPCLLNDEDVPEPTLLSQGDHAQWMIASCPDRLRHHNTRVQIWRELWR